MPLGLVGGMTSLENLIPRYLLAEASGEGVVGVFSALSYARILGARAIISFAQSIGPELASALSLGDWPLVDRTLRRLLLLASISGLVGLAVASAFGSEILSFVYAAEYSRHAGVFVWLMAGAALDFLSIVLFFYLTSARALRLQAQVTFLVVLSQALGCALLIPKAGLLGAAVALFAAAALKLALAITAVGIHRARGHR